MNTELTDPMPEREIDGASPGRPTPDRVSRVVRAAIALVVLGLVATVPPLWELV